MKLEQETKAYWAHVDELQGHLGKYVLIHGSDVVDILAAYEDALKQGYERFGLDNFMVRKIESPETVHHFTRDIDPCHT